MILIFSVDIREAGPVILNAQRALPLLSVTATATHREPSSFS